MPDTAALGVGATSRQFRARALAVMFGAGSVLTLSAMAVPHGGGVDRLAWAANASIGLPVAALLYLRGHRVPVWGLHVLLVVGAAMVALGLTFGGGGPASISTASFFVWVALYVSWFFDWRSAVAHVSVDTLLLTGALVVAGAPGAPAVCLLVVGTAAVVGVVVALMRRELLRVAMIDDLTGLPTRQVLDQALVCEIARANRRGFPLCLAVIDVDGLKSVNDRHGHQAGDMLLTGVACAWRGALRDSDTLFRFGGDEFVAILPDCTIEQAREVFERGRPTSASCSVGIACLEVGEDSVALFARSDLALYQAKAGGRASVVTSSDAQPQPCAVPVTAAAP